MSEIKVKLSQSHQSIGGVFIDQNNQGIGISVSSGGLVEVVHDNTLKGRGTRVNPLGVADAVLENIDSRVEKTDIADKIYGTDSEGNQTIYDKDSFGQVDDVLVNGTSVVTNKIAEVEVPTKTSDIINDSGFITKDVNDLTNYTKTEDLASVATSGSYNDLSDTPTIGDGTLTIQKNGTTVATFTANQTGNVTANIVADQQVQADWNEADTTAPDYIKNKPTKVSDFTNDADYQNSSQVEAAITVNDVQVNGSTVVSNKVASITLPAVIDNTTSESTTDVLSANQGRVLQSEIESLQGRGRYLSVWNCATGLAETNPPTSPYTYHNGDYFIVGTVAASGGTNYKPDGSSYTTGVASTTAETETVAVNDTYLYDGTVWHLQQNAQRETTFANVAGSPYDNQNLATALNSKANASELTEHISDTNNPHSVTKSQIGLGNVDNTSDLNKPISTATQTALNAKQDTLVSGTNIKTINNNSLLGSGDITIDSLPSQSGQSGKFLTTDGSDASWATVSQMTATYDATTKTITFA